MVLLDKGNIIGQRKVDAASKSSILSYLNKNLETINK